MAVPGPGCTKQPTGEPCVGDDCEPDTDPCEASTAGNGWYCAEALGQEENSRYLCVASVTNDIEPCEHGCEAGQCIQPNTDPCQSAPGGDGWYCAEALVLGEAGSRHHCVGGVTVDLEACELGCEAGQCISPDPCANSALGNGWYCAQSLEAGEPDTRYRCVDGLTAESEYCEYGCLRQPPGQHDLCAPPPSGYLLPLTCGYNARVSQGNNGSFSHTGMSAWAFDFAIPRGTVLVASRAGTVRRIKNDIRPGDPCWENGGYDCRNNVNYVVLSHDDGTDTVYLHLDEAGVAVGATVAMGQYIGLSGSTGYSTGPHLHWQRMERCTSWWCQSIPVSFDDVPFKDGVPESNDYVTSGNCP
jgi:hypothetical protein